jgi:hypothetical protein
VHGVPAVVTRATELQPGSSHRGRPSNESPLRRSCGHENPEWAGPLRASGPSPDDGQGSCKARISRYREGTQLVG